MKKWGWRLALLLMFIFLLPRAALAGDAKLIAITFDDGPSKYTSGLLDELAERQAVVTFFMQGCNAERYPSVVQKAYEAGHQIASHTYNHPYLTKLTSAERQSQLERTAAILDQAVGASGVSYMLRPPYGSYNAQVLAEIGVPAILWSVDTRDWQSRNADAVYQSIVDNSRDGSIILLHDLYPSTIKGALRGIDYLQAQGYELVTVRELLRRRGVAAEPGRTYSSAYAHGADLPGIAAPQISYDAASGLLSIASDTPNATVYYSLNNGTNGSERAVYSEPLAVSGRPLEISAFAALDLNGGRSKPSHLLFSHLGNCFADVRADSWYYEDVDRAVAAGLLTTNQNYFYPNALVTEQTAAILIQRQTNNLLTSAATAGAADQLLTRRQLALLLYQAKQLELNQPLAQPNADYALQWAVAQGIFTDAQKPAANVTRAELAAIALRFAAS